MKSLKEMLPLAGLISTMKAITKKVVQNNVKSSFWTTLYIA